MLEILGYTLLAILAAYLIPRLITAAIFQSVKDYYKKELKDGQEREKQQEQ